MKQYASVELHTIDQLANMSDNDLFNRLDGLNSYRNKALSEGYNAYYIEQEICYFRREEEIRNNRVDAHERWLKCNA